MARSSEPPSVLTVQLWVGGGGGGGQPTIMGARSPGTHYADVDPVTGPTHGPFRCTGLGEKCSVVDKGGLLQLASPLDAASFSGCWPKGGRMEEACRAA